MSHEFIRVRTKNQLRTLAADLATTCCFTWDLETAGLDAWADDAAVVLAAVTVGHTRTYTIPLDHPESVFQPSYVALTKKLAEWFETALLRGATQVLHNASFDLVYTWAQTKVDLTHGQTWDTMISSHLLRPSDRASVKLKEIVPATFKEASNWAEEGDIDFSKQTAREIPLDALEKYAGLDAFWTDKLYLYHAEHLFVAACTNEPVGNPVIRDEFEQYRLGELAIRVAMNTVKSTSRLQMTGMPVDRPTLDKFTNKAQKSYDENLTKVAARYDVELYEGPKKAPRRVAPTLAPTSKYFLTWMDHAVADGQATVIARTRTGKPQWDRHALAKLVRQGSDALADVLRARKASKRLEYLGSMREWSRDGVVHPFYRPGTLATGRLSASNPNPMQWESALKPVIKAPKGMVVLNTDYSQIELRVLAHIAEVPSMAQAYRNGEDLHKLTASLVAHVDLADVTKEQRQSAKASNFGLAFGQGAMSFRDYAENSYGVAMTMEEAAELHAKWFNAYPEVADWHADVKARLYKDAQIVSPSGRIRRFPKPWKENENAAINFAVQSLAGDLMQLALYDLTTHGPQVGIHPISAVHDSIVTLVPEDNWEQCAATVADSMTNRAVRSLERLMGTELTVPILVEHEAGTRWGMTNISHPAQAAP